MIMLIFIYYYKGVLSINDIQTLLKPMAEKYFKTEDDLNIGTIYEKIFSLEKQQVDFLKEDIVNKFETSKELFADAGEEDQEFLQLFSFIGLLSYDVYVKKLLIEKMVDSFESATTHKEK